MIMLVVAWFASATFSAQSLAQDTRVDLWGGLREGMDASEVQAVLQAKPEIASVKVRRKESSFGDDVELKYRSGGFAIAGVRTQLRLDMDGGKLHSVAIYPEFGVKPTCLSEGQRGLALFDELLNTKYTRTAVEPLVVQDGLGKYILSGFTNGSVYVFNRLYVSRPGLSSAFGRVIAQRCATDQGRTGTSSLLYVAKSSFDLRKQLEADAAAKKLKEAAEQL